MKILPVQPTLVEQVHAAILQEISDGKLAPGTRIIQEQLAQTLGVSRQPVQQALALLKSQGLLQDAPGRGLVVAPVDPDHVEAMYAMRAVIEGLACHRAAQCNAAQVARRGPALIEAGRRAVASESVPAMVAADIAFHQFVYEMSENPLIAPAMEMHWTYTNRVMGEVLMRDEHPLQIWDQHEAMVGAMASGDAELAERLARQHISQAADLIVKRLKAAQSAAQEVPAQ